MRRNSFRMRSSISPLVVSEITLVALVVVVDEHLDAKQIVDAGPRNRVSDDTKSDLYLATLPLDHGRPGEDLLDDERLRLQFLPLELRTTRNEGLIDHPPGQHDDFANAAAGALNAPLRAQRQVAATNRHDAIPLVELKEDMGMGTAHEAEAVLTVHNDLRGGVCLGDRWIGRHAQSESIRLNNRSRWLSNVGVVLE